MKHAGWRVGKAGCAVTRSEEFQVDQAGAIPNQTSFTSTSAMPSPSDAPSRYCAVVKFLIAAAAPIFRLLMVAASIASECEAPEEVPIVPLSAPKTSAP